VTVIDHVSSLGDGSRMPPRDDLIRARQELGVERSEGAEMPTLVGHAAVFNQWTEINSAYEGRFLERIAPGAFKKTISENRDRIRVLFQHGKDPQIGDKPLGPIRALEEDDTGLRYEVPLLDTSYNRDLIPGLDAGLYGASFRFSVLREEFQKRPERTDFNPLGLPERTVNELRMPEFGPVTFGAYANATSGLRSMTDEFRLPVPGYAGVSFANVGTADMWLRLGQPTTSSTELFSVQLQSDGDDHRDDTEPEHDAEVRLEPEPQATTPDVEPEPNATTRSERDLFWFAPNPALKGAK
jgi:HK97 family phage prohead protease